MPVYDIDCTDLSGKPLPLKQFAGKPLLIVNTASLCGFSSQFRGLEQIWQDHKNTGLTVIGVPSNDFGHQEPGQSRALATLCLEKFGVTFPLLEKTPVKGAEAHPLFRWLANEGGFWARPRWNFYKYLISREGRLKAWYSSLTAPETNRFQKAVTGLLGN